jgi:hypothetical protein
MEEPPYEIVAEYFNGRTTILLFEDPISVDELIRRLQLIKASYDIDSVYGEHNYRVYVELKT